MKIEELKIIEKGLQEKLQSIPGFPRTVSRYRKPVMREIEELYAQYPELSEERVVGWYYPVQD